ncbi:bifunctional homocysteine S-methyltransferase/methylenetetrahydrofolate reductase [Ruminiclostridium herbifermentans]|uniref:Bifunctional homocysteine S-methyltransferase/methylenetetrahydrofolate reductase n=1 Tax=Ruminiclostridium herbifermentans TaxID=2488810 RepID=A0A4U7JEM0_9FIRM|nr:bifunctional homocysteine S-methyltransferase/methylenetetrahydrofolate reductase [Ruminiclostridium herbifermentans]QNU67743.1 bifunctional homocysteine S-methyltransferase/methylenetetrahydrofolate reductase [Ruminiclostridium herbifermentans]
MNFFEEKDYFLFDGAIGTYYSSKFNKNTACELANLFDRDSIYNIHKEYIEAGADAIKTNTFGANRFSLACDQQEADKIIKMGWEIAKRAAEGTTTAVFADIGPIPVTEGFEVFEEYKRIVDIFLECGAEKFLFETFASYDILLELSAYIRLKLPKAVIFTSFAVYPDGYTKEGLFYIDIINKVSASGLVDAYGLNCISGPAHMLRLINDLNIEGRNIIIMPNSGYPSTERGRTVYIDNSEYFAEKILDLKKFGVKILGGCCGTTPRHIAATTKLFSESTTCCENPNESGSSSERIAPKQNILFQLLESKKPILVEIDPPFDTKWEYMLKDTFLLKQAGADMITIADSPLAKARADSSILAAKLYREAGIPTMPHITCRDKNLLGIKAMLLGLHIEGIRNVLTITGDSIAHTERENIKGVFSINSSKLAGYISSLNSNVFYGEEFKIGGALNINAANFEAELKRAFTKIQNGIGYFLTQAVYTDTGINNLIKAAKTLNVPIFAGIMPLVGYKNAQFINNEVPGIEIEQEIIEMFKDKSREESERIGINLSLNSINKLYNYVAGFYLMTPLRRTHVICELIKEIRNKSI